MLFTHRSHGTRSRVAMLLTVLACVCIVGCGSPRPGSADASSAATAGTAQQTGAPYPADMDHLDDILAIGTGHELPEQAQAVSVDYAHNRVLPPSAW